MAQFKNNQVSSLIRPSFQTKTTTPQMRGVVDMQSATRGVSGATPFNQSMIPGGQSRVPNNQNFRGNAPKVPGANNYTPISLQALNAPRQTPSIQTPYQPPVSTDTPQFNSNSNGTGNDLNNLKNKALEIQSLINQKNSNESNSRKLAESKDTTFRGILDTLLGRSNPQAEQERTRKEMERIAAGNKAIGDNAARMSKEYSDEIARVGGLKAGAVAGNLSTGTNIVGSGNAAIATQSANTRMQALAEAQQAALKGTEQQLTAQEQQANAFNPSLQASLTQQQLGLSGIGTAAGLAAPSVAPYGQTSFNPLTPGFAGGNMDPQTQASTIAQQLMSGQMTYDQAVEAMGYAGTAGTNFLNQALSSMGANPLQLQAQGTAAQTNLQTTGTATTGIARAGLEETTRDYNQLIGAADAAHRQAQNVNTILDKTGLNNVSSTDYNKALNSLQRRFSSTDFVALQTALNEAQIMYTNLLSTGGGTPTGNENNAITALNINQSAAAIKSSIQQLENAAANRLQAQQGIMQQYQQNLNSGAGTGGNASDWSW